jgi:hypothetical protein
MSKELYFQIKGTTFTETVRIMSDTALESSNTGMRCSNPDHGMDMAQCFPVLHCRQSLQRTGPPSPFKESYKTAEGFVFSKL